MATTNGQFTGKSANLKIAFLNLHLGFVDFPVMKKLSRGHTVINNCLNIIPDVTGFDIIVFETNLGLRRISWKQYSFVLKELRFTGAVFFYPETPIPLLVSLYAAPHLKARALHILPQSV